MSRARLINYLLLLLVVLFPMTGEPFGAFDQNSSFATWFRDATDGQGIASLDLHPIFEPYEPQDISIDTGGHLNKEGSRIAAEAIADVALSSLNISHQAH